MVSRGSSKGFVSILSNVGISKFTNFSISEMF